MPTVLLALAAAVGCASRDGGSATNADAAETGSDAGGGADPAVGTPGAEGSGEVSDEATADTDGGAAAGGAGPLAVDTVAVARARDVVRTGTMQLTVDDVDATTADVHRLATDAGGFVADEQVPGARPRGRYHRSGPSRPVRRRTAGDR